MSQAPIPLPVDEIAAEYREGMTHAQLADSYGVSTGTILRRLRAAGVRARSRGGRPCYALLARRLRMRQSGMSVLEIAAAEGVTPNAVWRQFQRHRERES